ncbi:MAG: hypothetical protein AB7U45_15370 [Desulfamplus sp.]
MILENVQFINENNIPKFVVLDFTEYKWIKDLLSDENRVEDYLDYLHMENVKKKSKQTYTLDEVKKALSEQHNSH